MSTGKAIILLHCPDRQGIITDVTGFITRNGGNIVYLDQYVDTIEKRLFMRIEWELDGFSIPREHIKQEVDAAFAERYEMYSSVYFSDEKPRMAIFVSKMSHCLYDLLARYYAGEWEVEIPCIVSNHEDLREVAEQFGIPFYVWRIAPDKSNDGMIARYPHHIINIHHSFLPAFVGARPYHQAYERGVKIIGATSHYVTRELDAGPIIEQDVVRITHKDTPESLVLKGRDLEKIVLSRAVTRHIERKILTYKNRTIVFG